MSEITTKMGSNPPPYITCFASKYLNGLKYFRSLILSFKSIATDKMNVSNSTPADREAAFFDFFLKDEIALPITINNSCKMNIPTIKMIISLFTFSPLLYLAIRAIDEASVTKLKMIILNKAASNFAQSCPL